MMTYIRNSFNFENTSSNKIVNIQIIHFQVLYFYI